MKQIRFGSSAAPLRLEFPPEWDAKLITSVDLVVRDRDGDELMASDAATLYTATTLDGGVARHLREVTLDSGAGDLDIGDPILIEGVIRDERHIVMGYDTSTKELTLEEILQAQHDDGDTVRGLFADYDLDVSDTDVFTEGIVVVLEWTPTGHGGVITEMVQVSISALDIAGLRLEFKDAWPRPYSAFTKPHDRFERMVKIAERELYREFKVVGLDIQRIVDQSEIIDALMAKMAAIWARGGDADKEDERETIANEYERIFAVTVKLPFWQDTNQDKIEDEQEKSDREHIFTEGW